jgi:hypothetical protein
MGAWVCAFVGGDIPIELPDDPLFPIEDPDDDPLFPIGLIPIPRIPIPRRARCGGQVHRSHLGAGGGTSMQSLSVRPSKVANPVTMSAPSIDPVNWMPRPTKTGREHDVWSVAVVPPTVKSVLAPKLLPFAVTTAV